MPLSKNIVDMTDVEMLNEVFEQVNLLVKGEANHCDIESCITMLISSLNYEHWKRGYIDGLIDYAMKTKLTSEVK